MVYSIYRKLMGGGGEYIVTTCLEERTKGETHEKEIMGEINIETLFYHLRKQKSSDFKKFPMVERLVHFMQLGSLFLLVIWVALMVL